MYSEVKFTLSLLENKQRSYFYILTLIRVLLGILDLVGILLIGVLLAKSAGQLSGNSGQITNSLQIVNNSYVQNLNLIDVAIFALLAFILKSALALGFIRLMSSTLAKSEARISIRLFAQLLASPIETIRKFTKPEISYSLVLSPGFGVTNLLSVFAIIISETALLVSIIFIFFLVDPFVTVFITIYFAILGILIYFAIGKRMHKAGSTYASTSTEASQTVEDSINTFREISTYGKHQEFIEKFDVSRKTLANSVASMSFLTSVPRYVVEAGLMVGTIGLAAYSFQSSDPTSAASSLGIFITGGLRIMASMLPLQNSLGLMKQLISQAKPFFDLENELKPFQRQIPLIEGLDLEEPISVALNSVSYVYPGATEKAVNTVSLEIKPGEFVAFIGPSGSGKSTIADLVMGVIKPSEGSILIGGGTNSGHHLGYVPQNPGVISGSIRNNITLNTFSGEYDEARLSNALLLSNLKEVVDQLEEGINENLGPQANGLSGGQLQRIGLARALYFQPGLIVLDEATSALDPESESAIAETITSLKGSCTVIVIAHRLATVQNADRVFVVENGEISDSGIFAELADSNSTLARYIELSEIKSL